jgi:outer membrane protein assembly complex protein YaeT
MSLLRFAVLMLAVGASDEGSIVKVHKLTFQGVRAIDEALLRRSLATRESSILPWARKQFFDRTRFEADLKRVDAFYADHGYPDGHVTDFKVEFTDDQRAVDLTIVVSEGEPVRIAAIHYVGFDVIPPDHLSRFQEAAPLRVGQPRERPQVLVTRELALNELRDHGYPYAETTVEESQESGVRDVEITFTAVPGPLSVFGRIEVSGNTSISEEVIRRELQYKPGELYRRSLVQESQRRLNASGLFQFVNVEIVSPDRRDIDVTTRVTVTEGKHHRLSFGVGYGTEEKARVDAEYRQINFFGGGRTAGARARWSSLDRGVRVELSQPHFPTPTFTVDLAGQHWEQFTPAYDTSVSGGLATLVYQKNARTTWSITAGSEYNSSSIAPDVLNDLSLYETLIALGLDPRTGEQNGTLNTIGADFRRATARNLLDANDGYQVALHAEQAGRFLKGTFNYWAFSADLRHYQPIRDRMTVATRLQFGNIHPENDFEANVPFAKRYFLGGASSIRGWGRYEVSPLSESGLPIGGNTTLTFTGELRARVHGNFSAVGFLDGGNVWERSSQVDLSTLVYAIGAGLRYQTVVGPIRFDYGYQLTPIEGLVVNGEPQSRRWRIHISIGQAF